MSEVAMIHTAMAAVMQEIEAIGKDRENKQQGFKFRGIDQVYNELHPLMAKFEIITVPRVLELIFREDRPTRSGGTVTYTLLKVEYDFISGKDGSKITVGPIIGEGMDSADKGCSKALAIAHKYALFQTFLIPTEDAVDPDFDTYDVGDPLEVPVTVTIPVFEVSPPATQFVSEPVVAVPAPEDGSSVDLLPLTTAAEAAIVTDVLIGLAENTYNGSRDQLVEFWHKEKARIDYLDTYYNDQYLRLKQAFTQVTNKLQEQPDGTVS